MVANAYVPALVRDVRAVQSAGIGLPPTSMFGHLRDDLDPTAMLASRVTGVAR